MPLQFITENPATDAYNTGVKNFQQQQAADLAIEGKLVENAERTAGAPSRLRNLKATTSQNESAADVAYRTRDAKVSHSKSSAAHSAADASVAQGTVGSRIEQQGAAARSATTEANVAAETAPTRVEERKVGLRSARANAVNNEMQGFYKSLDLLNAGRVDEARAVAQQAGQELPEAVITNSQIRTAITTAAKIAQETYPNRPADQQNYIQGYITEMGQRMATGGPPNDPTAPYTVPNAPQAPDTSAQSRFSLHTGRGPDPNDPTKPVDGLYTFDSTSGDKSFEPGYAVSRPGGAGGGGRSSSVYEQKKSAYLTVYPGDEKGALEYASGRKQLTEPELNRAAVSLAGREIANNTTLRFKTQAEQTAAVNKRAAEISQQLRSGIIGSPAPSSAAPAAPAPQPSPAGRLPADLRGQGSREQPFEATSQAHIDWFRQNAPAGSVLRANGQLYTK